MFHPIENVTTTVAGCVHAHPFMQVCKMVQGIRSLSPCVSRVVIVESP